MFSVRVFGIVLSFPAFFIVQHRVQFSMSLLPFTNPVLTHVLFGWFECEIHRLYAFFLHCQTEFVSTIPSVFLFLHGYGVYFCINV